MRTPVMAVLLRQVTRCRIQSQHVHDSHLRMLKARAADPGSVARSSCEQASRIDLPVFGSKTVIRISSRVSTDRLRQEMLHRIHDLLSAPPSTASLPFSFRTERNPRSFILLLTIATTGAVG